MKKVLLSIGIITLSLNLTACGKDNLVSHTYTVESLNNKGEYYASQSNGEGVAFTTKDVKGTLNKGQKVKVYFTKEEYENMEGLEKVEVIKWFKL